jgi:peroxiredoxin
MTQCMLGGEGAITEMTEIDQMQRMGGMARLPGFRLPSTEGREIGPQDLRRRKHLVLAFLQDPESPRSRGLLQDLSRSHGRFQALDARVLAIVGGDRETAQALHDEMTPPFPFLFDPDDRAARLCLGAEVDARPALLVLDRYGIVWAHLRPGGEDGAADVEGALEHVRFIAMQCPE